jgi:prevent-host-death family protein
MGWPDHVLVNMTRMRKIPMVAAGRSSSAPGQWLLHEAKARFSELVRRVRSEGPQRVTVHGRDEVVILSAEEYRRLNSERSGAAIIEAMQACPYPDVDFDADRDRSPAREVDW